MKVFLSLNVDFKQIFWYDDQNYSYCAYTMHIVHFFKPDDELHRAVTKKIPQNAFFFIAVCGPAAAEILDEQQ